MGSVDDRVFAQVRISCRELEESAADPGKSAGRGALADPARFDGAAAGGAEGVPDFEPELCGAIYTHYHGNAQRR